MNKSFCTMLWNNVSVDPMGNIKPCCISTDLIKKPNGIPYNLGRDKIEDFFNSPDYIDIREKMLKGEVVSGCSQCMQLESYGKESKRITTNRLFSEQQLQIYQKQSSIADTNIAYFDLRFGNLCNLKCRSCMPLNSSQLDKQAQDYPALKKFYPLSGYDINDWYETEIFNDNVFSNLQHIRLLYITGGEPTIIKKNFELLERLIDAGHSSQIGLIINSNLTNDKPVFFDLISKFKWVVFFASIDGYGAIQEYLRYPSDWKQIDKNMNRIVERNMTTVLLKVSPVVQIGNLGNIGELFEYCEMFNRAAGKLVVEIALNILENPNYLNILYLPNEYKIECWNKIETWVKDNCTYQPASFHSQLVTLKNKCFAQVDYQAELAKFFEFNELLDTCQNAKLIDVNPDLYLLKTK